MRILFVCSGNTCRSPFAEAVFRARAAARGLDGVEAVSAGTGALDGTAASEGTYLAALELGADVSGHRSRRLTRELIDEADLILTMGRAHRDVVERSGGAGKVHLLGEYAGLTGRAAEVPDPYGGDMDAYRAMATEVGGMIDRVLERLARERGA